MSDKEQNNKTKRGHCGSGSDSTALLCVNVDGDEFNIHIDTIPHRLEFEVFPVNVWLGLNDESKQRVYIGKDDEQTDLETFKPGECLKKMEGSFCWRGVWEGRLYFTDDEYWGEDIAILSKVYNDHIVPWCKEFIKKRDPGNHYDD